MKQRTITATYAKSKSRKRKITNLTSLTIGMSKRTQTSSKRSCFYEHEQTFISWNNRTSLYVNAVYWVQQTTWKKRIAFHTSGFTSAQLWIFRLPLFMFRVVFIFNLENVNLTSCESNMNVISKYTSRCQLAFYIYITFFSGLFQLTDSSKSLKCWKVILWSGWCI